MLFIYNCNLLCYHGRMSSIFYRNRQTGKLEEERIYGGKLIRFLYGTSKRSSIGFKLAHLVAYSPWISKVYGWWKRTSWTKRHIIPFIQLYQIKMEEYAVEAHGFTSFDAFFTRQLKPAARLISPEPSIAIIPADGRYRFFPKIDEATFFGVKGAMFNLARLLQDEALAQQYIGGSMVIARLAPCDYHRFHFPCSCLAKQAVPIKGPLYSVNPLALKRKLSILWANKRVLTMLESPDFGQVLYVEVGATNVGTIHQTFTPNTLCEKGAEKGYFSFGGSTLILLFEKDSIIFDQDLLDAGARDEEILCLMGQSMGRSKEEKG